ncbi:MAG: Nif3-like dinuclear metal center hexameric protein [Desulfuromonadales bacterium]|nr:Nif3-like dinuclear metal center hexameric protein [Desulfuromonadales bacterium]
MNLQKEARIHDIVGLLNALYPPALAEEWDNVGLQVGDPAAIVSQVAVSLDPSPAAVEAAIRLKAELLICHHPLIFRPLKQVTTNEETGRLIGSALRADLAIMVAHTNLDRAENGLNDWLAQTLELTKTLPLETPTGLLFKLIVFVPVEHEEIVASALFSAGAGHTGAYDRCSFRSFGKATFRPLAAAHPYIGKTGEIAAVDEVRIEVLVPKEALGRVVNRLIKAHPYEEVAYDIVPISNSRSQVGLGRIGSLPQPLSYDDTLAKIKTALQVATLRVAGPKNTTIKKIAVCGGSGASLLQAAARQGTDLFLTGDVGYHDARKAEELGLTLVDAGHFATEHIAVGCLTRTLQKEAENRGLNINISAVTGEYDPLRTV